MDSHYSSIYACAALRQQEIQAAAERRRALREARAAGANVVVVRRLTTRRWAAGAFLVGVGERVQGAERATALARSAAGDAATGATHLRPVR